VIDSPLLETYVCLLFILPITIPDVFKMSISFFTKEFVSDPSKSQDHRELF